MTENKLATRLFNAVWNGDLEVVKQALHSGADANWIYNGYPLLIHAVFTGNKEMVSLLIDEGATQCAEALGFALENGIGSVISVLAYRGIVPKTCERSKAFGSLPHRYAPLDLF